jgi:hypothetical protein
MSKGIQWHVAEAAASTVEHGKRLYKDGGSSILTHDRKRLNTGVKEAAVIMTWQAEKSRSKEVWSSGICEHGEQEKAVLGSVEEQLYVNMAGRGSVQGGRQYM